MLRGGSRGIHSNEHTHDAQRRTKGRGAAGGASLLSAGLEVDAIMTNAFRICFDLGATEGRLELLSPEEASREQERVQSPDWGQLKTEGQGLFFQSLHIPRRVSEWGLSVHWDRFQRETRGTV